MMEYKLTHSCQFDIINSNNFAHRKFMPPKRSKRNEGRQSAEAQKEVVAIEQHFRKAGDGDEVAEIMRRMEVAYKQNAVSLRNSLACFVLRVCGLPSVIPKLDFDHVNSSLVSNLELVQEKKLDFLPDTILLITPKDKNHENYLQNMKQFLSRLLSDEFQFIKSHKTNNLLTNLREWICILARSRYRAIRYSSLMLMKLLIESETNHFTVLINKKQSRKAFDFVKDVENYIPVIKDRIKDIDYHIRQCVQSTLKNILMSMETDIADQKTIEDIFLPLMKDNNPKIIEAALQTLLYLAQKTKKFKKILLIFLKENSFQTQKISILPNRNGIQTLKLMIELHKFDPQSNILHPSHISRIFEYYSLQNFTSGLQVAIDAFYNSIHPTYESLLQNKTFAVIQIMNLINNFSAKSVKQTIVTQFCENLKVSFQEIFVVDEVFTILLNESYNHNGSEIELKEKDIIGWILIIEIFITYVRKNIQRYELLQGEKFQKEKQKWTEIGESYNTNLLTNIKTIVHEKMRGQLTKYYLKLMNKLILPINSAFESYLDFMYEKIVAFFERESDPLIFKEIVQIFFKIKTHNIQMLTKNISIASKSKKDKLNSLLKKIAVLSQYYVEQFMTIETVQQLIQTYKSIEDEDLKVEMFLGLFVIHQWWLNYFIESDNEELRYRQYSNIKKMIVKFLFGVLESRERSNLKFAALNCLLKILQLICNDTFEGSEDIYYQLQENQVNIIYTLLNNEIGLPIIDKDHHEDSQTKDFTRMMNSLSFQESHKEKILAKIFTIFQCSYKIAIHPISLKFIAGALLAEDQKSENVDLSTTKQNMSLSFDRSSLLSIYSKQKLASHYFQKLIEREVLHQNRSTFVFWQIVQEVYKELKGHTKVKDSFTSKLMEIYLKKKLSKQSYKTSLNKALIFVVAEIDRIYESREFQSFSQIQIIMRKLIKRLNKQAIRRIYMFIKEKPEVTENKESLKNLLNFLDKSSKGNRVEPNEEAENNDSQEEDDNEVNEQVNQRQVMIPVNRDRETRSMSKRKDLRSS